MSRTTFKTIGTPLQHISQYQHMKNKRLCIERTHKIVNGKFETHVVFNFQEKPEPSKRKREEQEEQEQIEKHNENEEYEHDDFEFDVGETQMDEEKNGVDVEEEQRDYDALRDALLRVHAHKHHKCIMCPENATILCSNCDAWYCGGCDARYACCLFMTIVMTVACALMFD